MSPVDAVDSQATIATLARLEALASLEAQSGDSTAAAAEDSAPLEDGCRLAYSSVLIASSREEAQALLARIFTEALTKNPPKEIGGCMFFDEQSSAIVQVLEGPAAPVQALYHKIKEDTRHTSIKHLWEHQISSRQYEGFGMQLGSDPASVLAPDVDHDEGPMGFLQLTYVSQMVAATREAAYKDIEDILAVAIVTNPKLKIGGALFLNPRTLQVLQALEGPEPAVTSLYEKIEKDARHTSCEIVSKRTVLERTYDQWGMLQGDLSDWSSLTKGHSSMSSVIRRRRGRYAREDMDAEGSDKIGGGQPILKNEVKGELQVGAHGPIVVPVSRP